MFMLYLMYKVVLDYEWKWQKTSKKHEKTTNSKETTVKKSTKKDETVLEKQVNVNGNPVTVSVPKQSENNNDGMNINLTINLAGEEKKKRTTTTTKKKPAKKKTTTKKKTEEKKKKSHWWIWLLLLLLLFAVAFYFVYPYLKKDDTHTHSYSETWITDSSDHWHKCTGCEDIKDKAAHTYDNDCDTTCNVCEATRTTTHNYGTTYQSDDNNHWQECSACHTTTTAVAHTYSGDCDTTCNICGHERTVSISHTFGTEWFGAEDGHYHKCSICNMESTHEVHNNIRGKCSECDYIVETQGLSYSYNAETESYTVNDINLITTTDYIRIPSTYNDGEHDEHPVTKIGFVTPPSGYNTNVKSVIIPNSITEIGAATFTAMTGLENITIPESVETIFWGAFSGCSSLTNINVSGNNFKFEGNCLIDIKNKNIVLGINNPTIPADGSVTSIGSFAFYYFTVTEINIPETITNIGEFAFAFTGITEIIIPEGIETIDYGTFSNCTNLTQIVIPNSVDLIGIEAFKDCSALQKVYFYGTQDEWTSIEKRAGNSVLTSATIYYYSDNEPTTTGNYWHYENGAPTTWTTTGE